MKKNGCHFGNQIFQLIFLKEKFQILIKILTNFIPEGPIDDKSLLVKLVMAWCWISTKSLPEPMMTQFIDKYMGQASMFSCSNYI